MTDEGRSPPRVRISPRWSAASRGLDRRCLVQCLKKSSCAGITAGFLCSRPGHSSDTCFVVALGAGDRCCCIGPPCWSQAFSPSKVLGRGPFLQGRHSASTSSVGGHTSSAHGLRVAGVGVWAACRACFPRRGRSVNETDREG